MGTIASQITSLTIVYSTVYSDADQRKHQSSASLACVRGNHLRPVNFPHKWPVTRKMFPFDDVIMSFYGVASVRNQHPRECCTACDTFGTKPCVILRYGDLTPIRTDICQFFPFPWESIWRNEVPLPRRICRIAHKTDALICSAVLCLGQIISS